MAKIERSDLNYDDYSWKAVSGDDPTKVEEDADRFSRKEGYEVLDLLNSLAVHGGGEPSLRTLQVCEWMIHENLPADIQGRKKVRTWLADNIMEMVEDYPF